MAWRVKSSWWTIAPAMTPLRICPHATTYVSAFCTCLSIRAALPHATRVPVATGEFVVLMDCDCVPEVGFLAAHFAALGSGAAASTGHVIGEGQRFWCRYQIEASKRRQHQHEMGIPHAGSSRTLAIRRSTFETAGGFDTNYRRYGFEDRDLLVHAAEIGRIAWTSQAVVRHQDRINLSQVSAKKGARQGNIRRRNSSGDIRMPMHGSAMQQLTHACIRS